MRALLSKDRTVRSTIDVRLQMRVTNLLQKKLEPAQKRGALIVLDPDNGDVLALASFPTPKAAEPATPEELMDPRATANIHPARLSNW